VGALTIYLKVNPTQGRLRPSSVRGFTLLELLVVLVIAGIMLGVVSFTAFQNEQQVMRNEAQRIALLLQLARDEAIVRNTPVAFEIGDTSYRFLILNNNTNSDNNSNTNSDSNSNGWQPITQDEMFRERTFPRTPVNVSIDPPSLQQTNPLRIVFGREPVDKPFVLTLTQGNTHVAIHADGIGHYVVE
jgi:general secretion pathway protein H